MEKTAHAQKKLFLLDIRIYLKLSLPAGLSSDFQHFKSYISQMLYSFFLP